MGPTKCLVVFCLDFEDTRAKFLFSALHSARLLHPFHCTEEDS